MGLGLEEPLSPGVPLLEAEASVERAEVLAQDFPTSGPRARRTLRGRLFIAETGEPLDEELEVFLHTGDPRLAERVRTRPDGRFISTLVFPRGVVMARVLRPSGDTAVDQEIGFEPGEDVEWTVRVPWPTLLRGTLVDLDGNVLPGVQLTLSVHPMDGSGLHGRSSRKGGFQFTDLRPGRSLLRIWGGGGPPLDRSIEVQRGPNELGALRVALEPGGDVSGRLVSADGEVEAQLLLLATEGDLALSAATDDRGASPGSFLFADVPQGEYRLEILAQDGKRYEPASVRLSPPAHELRFEAVGSSETLELTAYEPMGEELDAHVLVRIHGQWLVHWGDHAHDDVEAWIAVASAHRPARGGRPEASSLRVPLEPGFGRVFLCVEIGGQLYLSETDGPRGRPAADVEILADGRVVARSDGEGIALIALPTSPGSLELRKNGWREFRRHSVGPLTLVVLERL